VFASRRDLAGVGRSRCEAGFRLATLAAGAVVAVELGLISYIRHRFMKTTWLSSALQVVVGGVLVLLAGILIGSS